MDRLQLAEKLLPWSEERNVCLQNSDLVFGWLYGREECKRAIECWNRGTLPGISFVTRNKANKTFTLEHPTRLGIVPHQGGKVSYFALDHDAHEGQQSNVHLQAKTARFLQSEPVLFHSKSGRGIRAVYLLNQSMDILNFLNIIRSWGFNRTGRIELFPKTEKLTQFWLPNDPNPQTRGDTFISGSWEKAVATLPQKIPISLTNATLDCLLGFVEPGGRHNALYAAAREMGQKRIQEGVSRKLLECGAQLCGLDPREASEAARDGYARGLTDNQRPTANQEQEEACSLPEIVWGAHYIQNGIPNLKPELIGGILRQSHKLLIGAPSKAFKSFLAIRLALAIALGREWFPGIPCKQGNVYIVNFELDDGSYMHRVKAIADALQWPMPANIAYHHLRGYGMDIEELFPAIASAIDGKNISAAIIDPQYKLLRSSQRSSFSENSSADMAYLYGFIDRHFSRNGISPVTVTHFAKGSATGKEAIDRIVGSGAPMRDADAICTLTALEANEAYRMEFALRDFKPQKPLSLQWEYPLHKVDPMLDSVPLKEPCRHGTTTGQDDETVLKVIRETGRINQTVVIAKTAAMKISRQRTTNSLQRLESSGTVTTEKGAKNATYYRTA